MPPYIIQGCEGGVEPRLEIRDLQKNAEQFTLFVLAFTDVKRANYETAAARFVEIAGIHGLPYSKWPGDPEGKSQGEPGKDQQWGGYCHHASVLFPTWHRVYILALEQSISVAAHAIAEGFANEYPNEAAKWREAANKLRFPFWDWTLPETGVTGLPDVVKVEKVPITMPGGKIIDAPNPVAYYDFQGAHPAGFTDVDESGNPLLPPGTAAVAYYSQWTRTYRWPQSQPENPTQDYTQIDKILRGEGKNPRGSYQDLINNVINMFSFDLDYPADWYPYAWDCFSNTTFETKGLAKLPLLADSVEHPHNTVHLVLGGIGAMGDNDYAGFDPIFFLHHTQVDRLLAFWEHIYPNYWMGLGYKNEQGELKPFTDEEGTWAELPDASINENTTLDPFRKPGNSYWKASETRFMAGMNYTYPPLAGVQLSLGQDIGVAQRAADLAALQRHLSMDPYALLKRVTPKDATFKLAPPIFADDVTSKVPGGYTPVHGFRHFAFSVELLEFAFNSSYYLEFLYQKTEETTVPVGIVPVLGRGASTLCAACNVRRARDNKVHGVVTIDTDIIVDIVLKENLNHSHTTHEEIIDALKRNIWAHLATRSGGRIASARYRDGQVSGAGRNTLPAEAIPKIIIASANLAERGREELGEGGGKALSYYDTVQHAEHLTEGWS